MGDHSARKTSISKLLDNNVHPLSVKQLSGHKCYESINAYHVASKNQQINMSNILSCHNNNTFSPSSTSAPSPNNVEIDFVKSCGTPSINTNNNTIDLSQSSSVGELKSFCPFQGASITNCTFNIIQHFHQNKKRIYVIDDSSDSE